MTKFKGESVYSGIAIGKLCLYSKNEKKIERNHVTDVENEKKRFEDAKTEAINQLKVLYDKALANVGETNALIFEVHQMMLEDLDYIESVLNIINTQGVNAEYAVGTTGDNFSAMFEAMDDAYMQGRAADIRDITERLLNILNGSNTDGLKLEEPVIICAEDLAPSETVQLEKDKLLGFVTRQGSANSHTAILARTMDIPAVIQANIEMLPEYNGKLVALDGFTGNIYLDPDEETLSEMKAKQQKCIEEKELLQTLKGKENVTQSGQVVQLYANIGNTKDVAAVLKNDAGGIGLFRSEFLYLESSDYPTENEQFLKYKAVAENMAGKKVIIRTLDIGADKQVDYFEMEKEENPALGYRAIRICLDRPEIFKTQLRALYRASVYGQIAIMFPMIISVSEVLQVKEIIKEVKEELKAQEIPFKDVELGIMIETPAAAIMSDELAKEVDFFSIGTNDLTQYTLAIDRQNPKLGKINDSHHPAVLRLIEMVVKNAHANGIWAGICGELGADTSLTEWFLKIGVDELSVSPSMVLKVRKQVRETK
ncbi:phosphoenolpyruvate--protein phosphotransferase [Anaerosacchariphilus polymeriproducens]|uniref:Phosphoenolpyruvate-protein phosphotransferase n=1 Tax=Anaerosacchariphilus polymeriproducens TaxID=1812858 RepID=A0A371B011_9FIRM|nr:phosphoenolpyruvate--protein phosphotransferase [Anaerosacchariphilus polymeriproducens]RDU25139.1 phosphoenolpyruvate--protein phosphotransferase [Anaerosacchariphilus polymeriproducens]